MLVVERVAALHRVDLFADVPGRTLAAVAATADELTVEAGATFIEHGAIEDCLYVVVAGRVRVHRGERTLVELGAGSAVGELAVLVPQPRTASVTALEPTLLLRVRKVVLDEVLADRPELASGVIGALAARLRATAEHAAGETPPGG
jgi:CRP/FNR family transcriptional regulator, cyclic AMP receptor protein